MNVRACIVGLAVFVQCATAISTALDARVVGVSDGDTITVLDADQHQWKIRLAGIDAPEKSQPFGQQSKHILSDRVFGKQVVIETGKTDRYGRTIGKVIVAGEDVNLEQVRAGLAWHYKKYEREQSAQDRMRYARAEEDARRGLRGIWQLPAPIAPWDYRKMKKEQ